MSLLRSHSSSAAKPDEDPDDDTAQTTPADDAGPAADPAADSQAADSPRYAFARPDGEAPAGAVPATLAETTPQPVPGFTPAPPATPAPVPGPRPTTGPDGEPATPAAPMTGTALDAPLLSDATQLRARWQRAQSGFVDDPAQAVGEAADLVEQTAQALVGALRQRQRQLRDQWKRGPAEDSADTDTTAQDVPDTEHLRLMMQRYRALFNQLCRPSQT